MGIRARAASWARANSWFAVSSAVKAPNNGCPLLRFLPKCKRSAFGCGFPPSSSRSLPIFLQASLNLAFLNATSGESGICPLLLPGEWLVGFRPGNNPPIRGNVVANPATLLAVARIMLSFMEMSLFIPFLYPKIECIP